VLFVQNYCRFPLRWDNSWSIAVEEHFYLALPPLLLTLAWWGKRQREAKPEQWFRRVLGVGFMIGGALLALRLWKGAQGAEWQTLYYPTHLRFDSLFFGVVLGYLYQFHRDRLIPVAKHWPYVLGLVALALLPPLFYTIDHVMCYTVGFTLLYFAFGGLVLVAALRPKWGYWGACSPLSRAFAWLGVYSYTVYLAHSVVYDMPGAEMLRDWVKSRAGPSGSLSSLWADRLLFYGLSIPGGVLLSHLVERPVLLIRDRFLPSRPRPVEERGDVPAVALLCLRRTG
jgi:peptidoglycan/LPS O-acetylase OafA/YrhL